MKNITPVLCLYAIAIFLLTSCNPISITLEAIPTNSAPPPTISATPIPTLTQTATYAPTQTPNGWYEGIESMLPSECQEKDPLVEDWIYENLEFISGSCKFPSLSPDGNFLAYVLAKRTGDSTSNAWLSQVVKIIPTGQTTLFEVYQSQKYSILRLEWSADGRLVIIDAPIEGSFSETVIYDPRNNHILDSLTGLTFEDSWNAQRTAFYTINHQGPADYGPVCDFGLSGYDFVHDVALHDIEFPSSDVNFYKIVDQPIWSPDGIKLWVVVRPGLGETPATFDSLYGPAFILEFDLTGSTPNQTILYSDPLLDFSLALQPNGNINTTSSPYQLLTCFQIP